jgi:Tfp pilus assembly protein PilF
MRNVLLLFILISLLASNCTHSQDCIDGINKLPMYGEVKKCKEQIEYDKSFIADCDKTFKDRKEAAAHMLKRGWQYLYDRKPDTAMMRFNQAWLLDSLNYEVYWGFADLLGMQGKFKESIYFFERSTRLNSGNARIWMDASNSYGNLFFTTKDKKYLNASISALKKAAVLDPKNPQVYGQLTSAYCYFTQKDSARKYLKITEKLDPSAVNPQAKTMLSSNK